MKTRFRLILMLLMISSFGFAQELQVSGTVTSNEDNMPLPGVSVIISGTARGTSTDFDGNYTLKVNQGDVLEFSFIGFKNTSVTVGSSSTINVVLETDVAALDEVVVVGYGTQKKADLTGSIATVKAEEIEKTPAANVMQSMQGKVAGVQIVSAGTPGDSPTVRIRGLGTYGSATNVLYVVDGMFYDNIDFLNSKDIESINVLKDASSSAIYGVRAANGVVLITTKTGKKNTKPVFEYDGYTGMQFATNVVKMANAEQFVTMAYESGSDADVQYVLNAMQRYGRSRVNPNLPDVNTDWYDEIMREGLISSHSISASGGGENVSYSLGANYFSQEGVLDMKNEYERFNLRNKVDVDISDRFKVGSNLVFSNATKYLPQNSAWFKAYFAVPILPVYDLQNTDATPTPYASAKALDYRNTQNPFPDLKYNNNRQKIRKFQSNFYVQAEIIPDKLTFKTTYNANLAAIEQRNVSLPYNMGYGDQRVSSITRRDNTYFNQIWDNTLTYEDHFGDHNVTLMGGTSYRDEAYNFLTGTGGDIRGIDYESSWYLDFSDPTPGERTVSENGTRYYGSSYFGRAAYNYKGKYLLYGTIRADGSSKFTQDPWGYFPSVGAGWVISEEGFMQGNGIFDFLKLRAAWGKLGNDNVGASSGANTTTEVIIAAGDEPLSGVTATSTFTNNTWEVVEEKNFGLNLVTLNNRLSLDADYYIRDTHDAIMPVYIPIANVTLQRNSGQIRNEGVEIVLNWNESVNENFSYSIGTNFTTLKNTTISIEDERGYIDSGSAEFRQRTMPGEPLLAFFGYERIGVYQNQTQIDQDPTAQAAIADGQDIKPGDLIYKDQNGDGAITEDDRVVLGSYLPKFTYGGNIGVTYKNWGFSASFYGQSGNKILNRKRGEVIFTNDTNMDADLAINRWHGEGTTNEYPSSAGLRKAWNQKLSDFWVEDGDFFRIQNIQISYTIKGDKLMNGKFPETRFTLTADRPFTFFKYNGFDPEVSDGVDRQTYPVPASCTVGINVKI